MIKLTHQIQIRSLLFISLIFLSSCKQPNDEIPSIDIYPERKISSINDSIYITDGVQELASSGRFLAIVDNKTNKTHFINRELTISHQIEHGEGPETIKEPYHVEFRNNKIYMSDFGKFRFTVFDEKGNILKSIRPPSEDLSTYLYKFAVNDSNEFFFTNILEDEGIIQIGSDERIINRFGDYFPYENEGHKRAINNRNLIVTENNNLIAVWTSKPIIDKYDPNGNLIQRLDLSNFYAFRTKRHEELLEQNPAYKYRLAFAYNNDVYYTNKKLYLLFIGDYEVPNSNQILVIDNSSEAMKPDVSYNLNLEGAFFKEIAVNGNRLWAYDKAGAEIITYNLNTK